MATLMLLLGYINVSPGMIGSRDIVLADILLFILNDAEEHHFLSMVFLCGDRDAGLAAISSLCHDGLAP